MRYSLKKDPWFLRSLRGGTEMNSTRSSSSSFVRYLNGIKSDGFFCLRFPYFSEFSPPQMALCDRLSVHSS